ncbi:MAG: alpha/beta fold hydrolase [Chloroflexota bacterium]
MTAGTSLAPSLAASARLAGADPSRASRLAVVDANTRWTWAELDGRADAVAAALTEHGVEPGDRVALLARPSAEVVAILHGIARVGAAAAPLGTGMTRREAGPVAAVLGARIVIAGPGFEDLGSLLADRVIGLPDVGGEGGRPIPAEKTPGDASAPAVAILTSGTTGRPKVAILSVAALTASAESWLAALPPATGWLLAVGLGHVAGMGVVWRSALAGVPLVVLERPDASAIVTALAVDPWPSHVSLVPTVLERVLDITRDAPPPATLRAVPVGGGSIPPALVTRALKAGWPVVPTYGLTEAGSGVTALPTSEAAVHPGSAGRALPGFQLRISAPDAGGIGDIEVRGDAIFDGYLGDPDATASALTADGWLRSGDLGSLDDAGRLTVADRGTDRIVRGGENISPAEVEAVLLDHPAVADAAVVARRDSGLGHVPVAAIVVRQDATDPGDEALAAFVGARLARFKVPVAFVRVDALPRTSGGKVRRADLRARLDPSTPREQRLVRPGGATIAYRTFGGGPRHILLLHGTLSTAAQLTGLARLIAETPDSTVHAVDRRGSGGSRLAEPQPIDVAVHVADLTAILEAEGAGAAAVVGISYGACVALEFAARRPDRTTAIVAYEPPYGPAADAETQAAFADVAANTERAFAQAGSPAAAEAFLTRVAGPDAWSNLPERTRTFLADEGGSAYADAALIGFDLDGLAAITSPVTIVTGDASQPFYRPIADALADRMPGARRIHLPGMSHASPITDPGPIADVIRAALEDRPA